MSHRLNINYTSLVIIPPIPLGEMNYSTLTGSGFSPGNFFPAMATTFQAGNPTLDVNATSFTPSAGPGTARNLIITAAGPNDIADIAFYVAINGIDTSIKAILHNGDTIASDTTHTASVNLGDSLSIHHDAFGDLPDQQMIIVFNVS